MDILDKINSILDEVGNVSVGSGSGGDGVIGDTPGTNTMKIAKLEKRKNIITKNKKKKKKKVEELIEEIVLDIQIGDVVLGGRFKNKKIKVNKIGTNDKGDLTINDRPFMKIRLPARRPVDNPDDSEIDKEETIASEVVY